MFVSIPHSNCPEIFCLTVRPVSAYQEAVPVSPFFSTEIARLLRGKEVQIGLLTPNPFFIAL